MTGYLATALLTALVLSWRHPLVEWFQHRLRAARTMASYRERYRTICACQEEK